MELKHRQIYAEALKLYENLSSCARLHVAAILVKDGRILSVGYNGTAPGDRHCNEIFVKDEHDRYYIDPDGPADECQLTQVSEQEWKERHHAFSEVHEIHAEMNCIAYATKNHTDVTDCDLVVSISPCIHCAKLILSVGIKHVYYVEEYDRNATAGIDFLTAHDVTCEKL